MHLCLNYQVKFWFVLTTAFDSSHKSNNVFYWATAISNVFNDVSDQIKLILSLTEQYFKAFL